MRTLVTLFMDKNEIDDNDDNLNIELVIAFIDDNYKIISVDKKEDNINNNKKLLTIKKEVSNNLTFDELKRIITNNDSDLKIKIYTDIDDKIE
jgi:hypothetical protein